MKYYEFETTDLQEAIDQAQAAANEYCKPFFVFAVRPSDALQVVEKFFIRPESANTRTQQKVLSVCPRAFSIPNHVSSISFWGGSR
jgi:hypothetical protein